MDALDWADDVDLEDLANDLTEFETVAETESLRLWRAWHQPMPQTSQLTALQMLAKYKTILVLGGNRSGKTEMMRAALVALALGSDHPIAREFWCNNGMDPDHFPPEPGRCYIVARSSNDSRRYHRQQIDDLIPGVRRWWNKNGKGEANVEIDCPGYDYPAEIWCKSEDQGADAMQGDSCRAILHDEEGDSPKVWDEADVRLWDQLGWHLMSNTPTKGRTWVWERFVRETPEGVGVTWIHSADNPYLPPEAIAKMAKSDDADARLRGRFVSATGLIYPMWDRRIHEVTLAQLGIPDGIPDDWPRYRAMDFGFRHPACVLWCAIGRDGLAVIYREHYQAEWTLQQHAAAIKVGDGEDHIQKAWADPSGAQEINDMRRVHGVYFRPGKRDFKAGKNQIQERLTPVEGGGPRLVVLKGCAPNLTREIEAYAWGKKGERPVDVDDHTLDTLRYLCMGIRRL